MQNISEELTKIKISPQDLNLTKLLDGVNKTCQSPQFFFPETLCWYNAHYSEFKDICQTKYERISFCPGFGGTSLNAKSSWSFTVTELDQTFPSLTDKLNKLVNQSDRMPSSANISIGFQKIKDLIDQTRDAANRVSSQESRGDVSPAASRCLISYVLVSRSGGRFCFLVMLTLNFDLLKT